MKQVKMNMFIYSKDFIRDVHLIVEKQEQLIWNYEIKDDRWF